MNLFPKINLILIIGFLLPFLLFSFFLGKEFYKISLNEVFARNELFLTSLLYEIDTIFSFIEGDILYLSRKLKNVEKEEAAEILKNHLEELKLFGKPIFSSLSLLNNKGELIALSPLKKEFLNLNFSHYLFFKKIISGEEIYLPNEVSLSFLTSKPVLEIAVPVEGGKNSPFVLVGETELESLNKLVNRFTLGKTGFTFLTDKNGTLITYPQKEAVLYRENIANFFPKLISEYQKSKEANLKMGDSLISFISPLIVDWKINFIQKEKEALSFFYIFLRAVLSSILLYLILIGIISISLSYKISKPIKELQAKTLEIAKGKFVKFELKTGDEIEKLAKDFNKMAEDLEKSRAVLEEAKTVLEIRVKARTRELEELTHRQEEIIKEKTKELRKKVADLERFQRLVVGRELKMIELKEEIKKLKEELKKSKGRKI